MYNKTEKKGSNPNYKNTNNLHKRKNKQFSYAPRTKKLNIEQLDENFIGIAKDSKGKIYHVKNVLPKERVEIELPRLKNKERENDYIYTPSKIISESDDRVKVSCPYISDCSNCNMLQMSYASQIRKKINNLNNILNPLGVRADNFIDGKPFGYRNKVHFAFTEVDRKTLVGFFNEETHRVVPVRKCLLHGKWYEMLAEILNNWATEYHIPAFKPWEENGILRFAVCRHIENNLMVTIVARENVKFMDKLYNELIKKFNNVSLYLNINNQNNSKVFSDKFIHINGDKKLKCSMLGINFALSPNSFFQVNEYIASKIYSVVLNKIEEYNVDTVIDAYSGIGITSMLFASKVKNVISIEIVPKAVEDAKELAELNGVFSKIKFICGDCNNILPKLEVPPNTAFFVDPPRKGLGEQVCRSIIKFMPEHIIYLSCEPKTLADDMKRLIAGGYKVESVTPFDMFANTKHIECLTLLSKV